MREPHPEDFDPDYAAKVNPNIKPEDVNLSGIERIKTRDEIEQERLSKENNGDSKKSAKKTAASKKPKQQKQKKESTKKKKTQNARKPENQNAGMPESQKPGKPESQKASIPETQNARKPAQKKNKSLPSQAQLVKVTFRVMPDEADFIDEMKFKLRRTYRATKDAVTQTAIQMLMEDYKSKGEDSYLVTELKKRLEET